MRRVMYLAVAVVLMSVVPLTYGQDGDAGNALQQRLKTQFPLTKLKADKSDIVTAGCVLVLQKDGLLLYDLTASLSPLNTYKDGHISQNAAKKVLRDLGNIWTKKSTYQPDPAKKTLVTGEKFWVTSITVQNDGVLFQFITDPYDDGRYSGQLKFPFAKGTTPTPDEIMKTIAEVLTVQPADGGNAKAQATAADRVAPASSQTAMAPIAPPPPPPDAAAPPKTISIGQSRDTVQASFGQPQKIVHLGTKELDYYPDMKVTFVNGKVTDVQ